MQIKIDNGNIVIDILNENILSWSYEEITRIYTIVLNNGTVWKYEKGKGLFYKLT